MQPQQPDNSGQQPTQPGGEYDFIFNSKQPVKAPLVANSSLPMRILLVAAGLFILMLIGIVFIKVLGGSGSFDKAAITSVAQDQTELMRLGDLGVQSSVSQVGKNLAVNVKLTTSTQRSQLLSYAATKGLKPKDKVLGLKQSAATTTELTNATSSSTFDTAYQAIIKQELIQYQQDLTKAYKGVGPEGQALLKDDFNGAQLLLQQIIQNTN